MFRGMLERHGKAFAFSPQEIGCADPKMIEPMVIFTVPHVPWNLKPIPVPRAHIPKLIELLKEKVRMGILEPSNAPYCHDMARLEPMTLPILEPSNAPYCHDMARLEPMTLCYMGRALDH